MFEPSGFFCKKVNKNNEIICSATVANLQAKVESLTTTNALMKEDLSISKNNILSLHYENQQLKKELGIEVTDCNEVDNHQTVFVTI